MSYVIATNVVTFLLSLISIPLLTKGLGASLFGIWSLLETTVKLIVPFATLYLSSGIVRFLAGEKDSRIVKEDFFSACTVVFISGTIFSLLLFSLADYLALYIFKDTGAASYIKFGSALVLINSLYPVLLAFFRMQRKIGLYSTLDVTYNISQVSLIVAAIMTGYSLGGVITAFMVSGILVIVISLSIIFRQIGGHVPRFSNMKSYLKWGIPLTPNLAILWIISVSDRYMISYFLGTASVGIYSASYALGQYASFILIPLGIVLYPTLSKHYNEGNPEQAGKYLSYSFKYLMTITIPAAFGLSILAKPLLRILTTPEFVTGSNVVPWVAFGALLYCFYYMCLYVIQLEGKTYLTVRLLGTSAIANIILNLVLIPRMGIVGAAIATFIAYGVLGALSLLVTRRYLKFDLSLPLIGKSILASAMMTLCIWAIRPESISLVIVTILAGVIIYFGVMLLLRSFSRQELHFFSTFIRDNIRTILKLA